MELLVFGCVTAIYGIIGIFTVKDSPEDHLIHVTSVFIGAVGIIVSLLLIFTTRDIKPIDVYRGKTELKITETKIDSLVVKRDTVVVWKEKYLK